MYSRVNDSLNTTVYNVALIEDHAEKSDRTVRFMLGMPLLVCV